MTTQRKTSRSPISAKTARLKADKHPAIGTVRVKTKTKATKVGVRDFRQSLQKYLDAKQPVAVTRHGETIGYFIPSRDPKVHDDVTALRAAAVKLDALLTAQGVDRDELVAEFERLRAGDA